MSRENVELVRRGFEAFARGDVEATLDLIAEDVDWYPAIAPILGVDTLRGKDALRHFFLRELPDGFDEFRAEPLSFDDFGDKVLVISRYVGRGKGSGLQIDQTFATVYQVTGGKIVRMRDYTTKDEALEAVALRE